MKSSFKLMFILIIVGIMVIGFYNTETQGQWSSGGGGTWKWSRISSPTPSPTSTPTPTPTPTPTDCSEIENNLSTCNDNLNACLDDLSVCEAEPSQTCPGDGYNNPDAFGISGHGPSLSYTDNGNGTFTDNNTGLMWEKKDDAGGIHDKDNTYTWTDTGDGNNTNPDGTLFTVFLDSLNNSCNGDGVVPCNTDADCVGIGNEVCGFAGYQDWRIPNAKELQSIVDYSVANPASSVPGLTPVANIWTVTTDATPGFGGGGLVGAFFVAFNTGAVIENSKFNSYGGRAVRP